MNKPLFYKTIILVMLTIFILAFLGCTQEATPIQPVEVAEADFEVISLEVSPTEVAEGTPALVIVEIENTGEADGTYTIVLKANGIEKVSKDINISSGTTEVVSFEFTEINIGTHTLEVGDKTASLKIEGKGYLSQGLAQLVDSNGEIVFLEQLEIDLPVKDEVEVYRMRYLSDGLEVVGFIAKPKEKENDIEYPVIIFNRGGNREFGKIETPFLMSMSFFAYQGYVTVASQYRGNDGGEGQEEFGGSDVNDVLNLIPMVESLPFATGDRIGMFGFSRGGMMTYIALSMTDKVKAAAVIGGVTDLFALYEEREAEMKQVMIDLIGGTPTEKEEEYKKRSAYYWPEKIETPLLILHGGDDWRVSVTQAQKLAEKLEELDKTYELVIYPGGDHGLSGHQKDSTERGLKWFKEYLK